MISHVFKKKLDFVRATKPVEFELGLLTPDKTEDLPTVSGTYHQSEGKYNKKKSSLTVLISDQHKDKINTIETEAFAYLDENIKIITGDENAVVQFDRDSTLAELDDETVWVVYDMLKEDESFFTTKIFLDKKIVFRKDESKLVPTQIKLVEENDNVYMNCNYSGFYIDRDERRIFLITSCDLLVICSQGEAPPDPKINKFEMMGFQFSKATTDKTSKKRKAVDDVIEI